jgi:pimeloyl-ACP methyl ester carboxylesterase
MGTKSALFHQPLMESLMPQDFTERTLEVRHDPLDLRDLTYRSALLELPETFIPTELPILVQDQIVDGPCTGFAMASVLDMQLVHRWVDSGKIGKRPSQASARMLYEMARSHDEFDNELPGSSLRGVVKGFYHHGVAPHDYEFDPMFGVPWTLGIERAKEARSIGLGAYYRLQPSINDYHSAIREVGAILVSARIHSGWDRAKLKNARTLSNLAVKDSLEIPWSSDRPDIGGHAFAIVGYDDSGFIVLNSWGAKWGRFAGTKGLCRWTYEDWAHNVMDAWVLRLSAPTPRAFDLTVGLQGVANRQVSQTRRVGVTIPCREALGHFINVDDGQLMQRGAYPTTAQSIAETAKFLRNDIGEQAKYPHLLIYAHGGLNTQQDALGQVCAMKETWKRNGVYPMHLVWNTGLVGESGDIFARIFDQSRTRVGSTLSDAGDAALEFLTRPIGRGLWREMKSGAAKAFSTLPGPGEAYAPINELISAARQAGKKVHLVGHSAGAIILGHLVSELSAKHPPSETAIATVSLLAPACTLDFFKSAWARTASRLLDKFGIYILNDKLEHADTVLTYNKSLLYLVSRAYEEDRDMPILGMQSFVEPARLSSAALAAAALHVSAGIAASVRSGVSTTATTHGGFDDDPTTLNHVLTQILGRRPRPGNGFCKN